MGNLFNKKPRIDPNVEKEKERERIDLALRKRHDERMEWLERYEKRKNIMKENYKKNVVPYLGKIPERIVVGDENNIWELTVAKIHETDEKPTLNLYFNGIPVSHISDKSCYWSNRPLIEIL
jgi:hypothetical protein